MEKSNCCNKATQVKGDTTKYYVCTLCDKACDVGGEKTVEEMFDEEWASFDMDECRDVDRDLIKQFIAKHYMPKNTPMGVSEWKEHGKKYGYDEYFKKDYISRKVVEAEVAGMVLEEQTTARGVIFGNGYYKALQDLKQALTNK